MKGLSDGAQEVFRRCKEKSRQEIERMREAAREIFRDRDHDRFIVGICGSYARREATGGSDADFFFLTLNDDSTDVKKDQNRYREEISRLDIKLPTSQGLFENPLPVNAVRNNIGGDNDVNINITRRMLLLLEGDWLFNQVHFTKARKDLLDQYLRDKPSEDKICMFLLNDIVRYWRTICVDFEYKVNMDNKPREIRLLKIRFSRMLLHVSGLLSVGKTYKVPAGEKRDVLLDLLTRPPVERFQEIVGDKGNTILEMYAEFLHYMDDDNVRRILETTPSEKESDEFREINRRAHQFKEQMYEIIVSHFDDEQNPTIRSLIL